MSQTATKLARQPETATVQVHLFQQPNVEYIRCDAETLHFLLRVAGERFEESHYAKRRIAR